MDDRIKAVSTQKRRIEAKLAEPAEKAVSLVVFVVLLRPTWPLSSPLTWTRLSGRDWTRHAASAQTADHVVARAYLLKVPACGDCNNRKSQLEHYVLSVLPMGGVHPGAAEATVNKVGPRLAKNTALQRALFVGQRDRLVTTPDGCWWQGMSLPFEAERLATLGCYIALGLAWHHWGVQIAPSVLANARSFTSKGTQFFEQMWERFYAGGRVEHNWGDGVFAYRGVSVRTNPKVPLWQMSFFGGVELADSQKPGQTSRTLFVATNDDPEWIATRGARRASARAPIGLD
ncbi:hypothetical protein [Paraburkholderia sacchari]|uniref:hypothetical protein n=1 Tax=Paraburkholderia sacchari TaxID=159450 RepID=UPI001BCE679C|nr:hypothetical protein [Paraburkholderia sacchari]